MFMFDFDWIQSIEFAALSCSQIHMKKKKSNYKYSDPTVRFEEAAQAPTQLWVSEKKGRRSSTAQTLNHCFVCSSVYTCLVRSSAEAWGIVLYICPSISLSWDTMGAKLWRSVFTDFSKMAHTAWGATWDQPRWNVDQSLINAAMCRRLGLIWLTSTTCESVSHLLRTVCMRAKTCCRTTTTWDTFNHTNNTVNETDQYLSGHHIRQWHVTHRSTFTGNIRTHFCRSNSPFWDVMSLDVFTEVNTDATLEHVYIISEVILRSMSINFITLPSFSEGPLYLPMGAVSFDPSKR